MTNEEKQKELGLNDKQALFCIEYVKNGFVPKLAYNQVYKPVNPNVGDPSSCRLLKNVKISQFIAFLKIPKSLEFEITRESQLKQLGEVIRLAQVQDERGRQQLQVVLKAVEIQNKMLGLDAPTKIEVTGKDAGAIELNNNIKITLQ